MFQENSSMLMAAAPVTLVLVSASIVHNWLRPRLESKKPFDDFPMPTGSHWLLGHAVVEFTKEFVFTFQKTFVDFADTLGRTGIWSLNQPVLVLTNWQDARAVLSAEYNHREFGKVLVKHFNRFIGPQNIFSINGREWRYHRTAIMKAFSPAAVQSYKKTMVEVIETVTAALKQEITLKSQSPKKGEIDGIILNVETLSKMITIDIFGLTAFSHDFGSCAGLSLSPIAEAFDFLGQDLIRRIGTNPVHPLNFFYQIPTEANRKNAKANKLLKSFVQQKMKSIEFNSQGSNSMNDGERKNLLTLVLEGHETASKEFNYNAEFSSNTMNDIMMSLLFAGYDSTSVTLTYAFYMVSQHPQVEATLLEELQRCDATNADELVYCKAVLYEVLRLYPSAPMTNRKLLKPIRLSDGYVVPAGITILIPIWTIHRKEENFPRALEFLPERWVERGHDGIWKDRSIEHDDPTLNIDSLSYSGVPAANPKAFLAFSAGGRNCAGQKFAWQEATVVLAGLLKEFRFEAMDGYELQPERNAVIQHPKGGIPMKITARSFSK